MGSTRFRNPQALSSALASLGMLQPQAFGFLDPLVLAFSLEIIDLLEWSTGLLQCALCTIYVLWGLCSFGSQLN